MVALNWQTPDENMWLHRSFFSRNGGCGYILKPDYLRAVKNTSFNPFDPTALETFAPVQLHVNVIETRNVPMHDNKPSSHIFGNVSAGEEEQRGEPVCVPLVSSSFQGCTR